MQFITVLSIALVALGATAQKTGPNGKRICVDSHENGQGTPAFIDPNCSCPEGQADNLYTGATTCIDVVRALGRQGC
jgi:hypothetical protein